MTYPKIIAATVAVTAAAAMLATATTPAIAAPQMGADFGGAPHAAVLLSDSSADYRRWGRHRHHRVSGDDILTGIGILAGIAILADVLSKDEQRNWREREDRRTERLPEPRPDPRNYPPIASADIPAAGDDIGAAIAACNRAVEDAAGGKGRVETIESVTRNGVSWRVVGRLTGNASSNFTCDTTNGRIDSVKFGASAI
jgi:hypothetical protein